MGDAADRAINALNRDPVLRDGAIAAAPQLAEQARAAVRNQLAFVESQDVIDGVGVLSLQFSRYTGP